MFVIMMLALAGSVGTASAQVVLSDKTGWHKIGSTTLDFDKTKAEMSVMGADKFASLRFKAEDAPVTLSGIDIYFEDGGTQHINLNESLKASKEEKGMMTDKEKNAEMETSSAGMSKEIMLTDAERSIDKIVITYKAVASVKKEKMMSDEKVSGNERSDYKKPVLEIWGLKTNWDKENPKP